MFTNIRQVWSSLSRKEQVLSILVLISLWGGIAAAILLSSAGIISDPGQFFWGCVIGSVLLAYLAAGKQRRDLVSLLTPLYAVIIFMGLEITPTLLLQILYAGTLSVLLVRLHQQFS